MEKEEKQHISDFAAELVFGNLLHCERKKRKKLKSSMTTESPVALSFPKQSLEVAYNLFSFSDCVQYINAKRILP